MNEESMWLHT